MTLRQAIHKAAQYVAHTTLTVAVYTDDNKGYGWAVLASDSSWLKDVTTMCSITGSWDRAMTVKWAEMLMRDEAGIC